MEKYYMGQEYNGSPAHNVQFVVERNPEYAKATADLQNFYECIASELGQNNMQTTLLTYNWDANAINSSGVTRTGIKRFDISGEASEKEFVSKNFQHFEACEIN